MGPLKFSERFSGFVFVASDGDTDVSPPSVCTVLIGIIVVVVVDVVVVDVVLTGSGFCPNVSLAAPWND